MQPLQDHLVASPLWISVALSPLPQTPYLTLRMLKVNRLLLLLLTWVLQIFTVCIKSQYQLGLYSVLTRLIILLYLVCNDQ